MRALKLLGKILLVVAGVVVAVVLAALAVNYRPSKVVGRSVDPGPIQVLDAKPARLADYSGRVMLLAFGTST